MSDAKPPRTKRTPKPKKPARDIATRDGATREIAMRDFAILGGPTEDGQGTHLLRVREGAVSVGEIRPVREGEPVTHRELVRLHPVDSERRVCRVETLHAPPQEASPAPTDTQLSRPARVSNERYRKNWDAIFDANGERRKRDWSVN
jgi:hypothetical protein